MSVLSVASPKKAPEVHFSPATRLRLLAPALAVTALFFVVPMGYMFYQSVHEFTGPAQPSGSLTGHNYAIFVSEPYYRGIVVRTLVVTCTVCVITLVLGFPLGYVIARSPGRWGSVLSAVIIVPLMTSVITRSYGWMILLARGGPVESAREALHFPGSALLYTDLGAILALTHVLLPFMVFAISSAITNVSPELERAAENLGASRIATFRDVVVPLSMSGIHSGLLLVFSLGLSAYATLLMVGGPTLHVLPTFVYGQATAGLNWQVASAGGFILLILVLLATALWTHLRRRNI